MTCFYTWGSLYDPNCWRSLYAQNHILFYVCAFVYTIIHLFGWGSSYDPCQYLAFFYKNIYMGSIIWPRLVSGHFFVKLFGWGSLYDPSLWKSHYMTCFYTWGSFYDPNCWRSLYDQNHILFYVVCAFVYTIMLTVIT